MTDEERLDVCRRSYAAFAARDADKATGLYHPDCEWVMGEIALAVDTPVFTGHAGLRDFMSLLREDFEEFDCQIVEARAREDLVLIRGMVAGRPLSAEMMVEQRLAQVIEVQDGLIRRVTQTDDPPPGWDVGRPLG